MANELRENENNVELIDRWNFLILWNLKDEPLRFTEFKRIEGISTKTISNRLKVLESYRLINRVIYAEVPQRVEYSLTEKGKTLIPIIDDFFNWGKTVLRK
ncbi:MAG: helix-turn-helix transcriptional regulator [Candidatus Bathyarchaeota archaeon]|nr:helix-turn-helix transcriptional regulator [Candidatus Bathyarchaeota archaeon]